MIAETRILGLIGKVYDAAEDLALWPSLLEELGDCLGGAACGFTVHDLNSHRTRVGLAARLDPANMQEYGDYYHTLDLFTTRGRPIQLRGQSLASHTYLSDYELSRSEYFNDFLKRQSLFYNVAASVAVDEHTTAFFTALRSREAGPFDKSEQRFLDVLLPHFSRAARLLTKLQAAEAGYGVLDSLCAGVIFVDCSGKVLYLNTSAQKILAGNDGLRLTPKGLVLTYSGESPRSVSELCVAAATPPTINASPTVLSVTRPSGKRPYLLQISAVCTSELARVFGSAGSVIWINDTEISTAARPATLRALFGFTPAELRLVEQLSAGEDMKEASVRLNITHNTARSQLRSIFEKTGVKRQAELMSLIARTGTPAKAANA